ncbi:rCG48970 [Rattus norvegicus]|uniref:RCG48970 n=1 Tax=Rattus norvegicus TaxID=10116 RepID=A6IGE7_RAT|nr:rCG48970 [Rattus norvegicus]
MSCLFFRCWFSLSVECFSILHCLLPGLDGIQTYRGKYLHPVGVLGPLFIHQKKKRRRGERKMDLLTRL